MWIELFKTGFWNGQQWNMDMVNDVIRNHERLKESPITIDHPENSKIAKSAAWGWITGLKKQGNVLMGKMDSLVPEFALMLSKGMFKKRSIGIKKDENGWYLDHLAFLGAKAPAVAGLKDIDFSTDGEVFTFDADLKDFTYPNPTEGDNMDIKELQAKLDEANASISTFEAEKKDLTSKVEKLAEFEKKVKELEAQVATVKNDGADKTAEFEAIKKENEALKASVGTIQTELKTAKFEAYCKENIEAGKLLPADKAATLAIMNTLDGQESVDFSAADGKTEKKTPLAIFQDSITGRKSQVEFAELAKKNAVIESEAQGNAKLRVEMHKLAASMNKDFNADYQELQTLVFEAHPEIAKAVGGI